MSNFECTQCGLCCLGIGEIVTMKDQISRYGFRVKNEVVGETNAVLITPEYRELFDSDKSIQNEHSSACFFVRKRSDGKYVCTIHPGRLLICKDYHCCTARISKNGEEVARVKGRVSIVTKDEHLKEIWLEGVQKHPSPERKYIDELLKSQGYSVLFYDSEWVSCESGKSSLHRWKRGETRREMQVLYSLKIFYHQWERGEKSCLSFLPEGTSYQRAWNLKSNRSWMCWWTKGRLHQHWKYYLITKPIH